jgi:hypothetical protein
MLENLKIKVGMPNYSRAVREALAHKYFSSNIGPNDLFQLPEKSTNSVCHPKDFSFSGFDLFLQGFTRVFKLNMGSSSICNTAALSVHLYISLYFVHYTLFPKYVASNSIIINCPAFIMNILYKVSAQSRSKNKITGWVNGSIVGKDVLGVYNAITDISDDDLRGILSNTIFSRIAYDNRLFDAFSSDYHKRILHASDVNGVFEYVLNILQETPEMVHPRTEFPMFQGTLETYITHFIGLYRFRDHDGGRYLVQQSTLTTINNETLNLFACFMIIYAPTFVIDGNTVHGTMLPGDILFDLTPYDEVLAWEKYVSYVYASPGGGSSGQRRARRERDRPRSTATPNEQVSNGQSESDNTQTRSLNDGIGDNIVVAYGTYNIYHFVSTKSFSVGLLSDPNHSDHAGAWETYG